MAFQNTYAFRKKLGVILCGIWMAFAIAQEFFFADTSGFGYQTQEMELKLQACVGTFQQRYDCKNRLIINKQYADFERFAGSCAVIFAPPLLLMSLIRLTRPKPRRGSKFDDEDGATIDLPKWRRRS